MEKERLPSETEKEEKTRCIQYVSVVGVLPLLMNHEAIWVFLNKRN